MPQRPVTHLKAQSVPVGQLRGRPPSTPIVTIRSARTIGNDAQQPPHPSVGRAANITN